MGGHKCSIKFPEGCIKIESPAFFGRIISVNEVCCIKQREKNLSDEDRRLLKAYLRRRHSYGNYSRRQLDTDLNATDYLLRKKSLFEKAIHEQREYEALSPREQQELDARIRQTIQNKRYFSRHGR